MFKFSLAAFALSLMLMTGCVHHRDANARVESVHTETTRSQAGMPSDPGGRTTQETQTTQTHRESTTTQ